MRRGDYSEDVSICKRIGWESVVFAQSICLVSIPGCLFESCPEECQVLLGSGRSRIEMLSPACLLSCYLCT